MTPPPDAVRELHAAVRQWTAHIPQNLPYVDLMFAFAHATRGDRARAAELVEDARRVMEVPIPEAWQDIKQFEATVAAVTSNFLFKAFWYRIEQALVGKPLGGRMSVELAAELAQIRANVCSAGTNNPYQRAEHVIQKMRSVHRLLEPQDDVDPYASWTKHQDALKKALFELGELNDPTELAVRARKLLAEGVPGERGRFFRLTVLHDVLPLAPRAGEVFAAELVQAVPDVLATSEVTPHPGAVPPDLPRKQGEVLERALSLAVLYDRRDLAPQFVDAFLGLVRAKSDEDRFRVVNAAAGPCVRALRKLGLRADIDRVLKALEGEAVRGATAAELRARYGAKPEAWAAALQTLLYLAAGWQMLGSPDRAAPILDEARNELLGATRIPAKEYTDLVRAYAAALAEAPAEVCFARVIELFREMPRNRITNTWTTAQYYSRFHLVLVEDVVFAICGTAPDAPHVVPA